MKKSFAFAASFRAARLPLGAALGAAFGVALALACAPARAEDCPRGQFFLKSKKSCIDKAEAARLGLYHGRVPAQPKDKASDKVETEKPAESPSDATPASDAAVAPPAQAPDAMPQPVAVEPAEAPPPRPSPYGELVIEDFAKAK